MPLNRERRPGGDRTALKKTIIGNSADDLAETASAAQARDAQPKPGEHYPGDLDEGRALTPIDYIRLGFCVVPIPRGQKKPAITGWQNFSAAIEDAPRLFGNGRI